MGRAFQRDLMTLAVLGIGGYLIYTKTDWFQQGFEVIKEMMGEFGLGSKGGKGIGGIGGGDLSAGPTGLINVGTGKIWTAKDSGKTKRNYASGGSSGTTQFDAKGVGAVNNLESTVDFDWPSGCNDTMSIKHYGPNHSDGKCCWLIMNIDGSGKFFLGGEGPHPRTSKANLATGSSMGSLKGKRVQAKLVTWIDSQVHARGYGHVGGKWQQFISWDGAEFGNNKKSGKPASDANVQFRMDCSGVKIHRATTAEIKAPSSSNFTRLSAGQYSNSLFTHNKPIPVNYYNSRLIDVIPYCDQVPKGYLGSCYDSGDYE